MITKTHRLFGLLLLYSGYMAAGGLAATTDALADSRSQFGSALSLSSSAQGRADDTIQQALETLVSGKVARWQDPASGAKGSVQPLRTFKIRSGHFCRQFEEVVSRGMEQAIRVGTACRNDRGRWILVSPKGT